HDDACRHSGTGTLALADRRRAIDRGSAETVRRRPGEYRNDRAHHFLRRRRRAHADPWLLLAVTTERTGGAMTPVSLALAAFAAAGLAGSALAAEVSPQDFAFGMAIETAVPGSAYRFAVPAEIYTKVAHDDLRDIRVFNARGEVVPYELQSPRA